MNNHNTNYDNKDNSYIQVMIWIEFDIELSPLADYELSPLDDIELSPLVDKFYIFIISL